MDLHSLVFLLAPPILGTWLLYLRRGERRVSLFALLGYLVFLVVVITAALLFVAHIATARLPWSEVAIVVWATIGLRLAWEVWARTVGRIGVKRAITPPQNPDAEGEVPRTARRGSWMLAALRAGLTVIVLVPALLAAVLTHRFKLADGTDPRTTLGAAYESVQIPTRAGGVLDAWFVPGPRDGGRVGESSDRTLVICHGAGANKGNFIWYLPALMYHGWNIVLFDFRAHGGSSGRVCTYGLSEKDDVLAVVDWLKHERPAAARRVLGLGSSLGAMALARAAAEEVRIDAVILDSPFTSPRTLAGEKLGSVPVLGPALADLVLCEMSWIAGADFLHDGAEGAVRAISPRPVLIIHGDDDVLMPRAHSERLYELAGEPRRIWFGPGPHSNIVTSVPEEYAEHVFNFVRETCPWYAE